jgi:ketosteroid isomerase-like protein
MQRQSVVRRNATALAFLGLALASVARGVDMSEATAAEVRNGVQATLDAFRAHSAAGDWDAVTALYLDSPQFRWIEDGRVKYRSVDEIRTSLTGMPAGTRIQTTYEDTEITPLSADVAVVVTRFATRVRIPQSGGFSFGGTMTITFVRHDGQWKIAAGHTSSPFNSR